MALIKSYQGIDPRIDPTVFLAENATIIGKVHIGAGSSIWYNAVLRGDVDAIHIGRNTNIQDFAMIHCSTDRCPTVIGDQVTVGHHAILHGCKVEGESLIGMGAVVMDEAIVPRLCMVAAKALVLEGMVLESGYLYAGIPARKIKALEAAHLKVIKESADHYIEQSAHHR